MSTSAAAIDSKTSAEYLKNAEDKYNSFLLAHDFTSRNKTLKDWQASVITWHEKDRTACITYLETTILPKFFGEEISYINQANSLTILCFLKKLSNDAFLRHVNKILSSEKQLKQLCTRMLAQKEYDEELKNTPIALQAMIPNILKFFEKNPLFGDFAQRLIPQYTKELIAALPNVIPNSPGFLHYIYSHLKIIASANASPDAMLLKAIEDHMQSYCMHSHEGCYHQMLFLDVLFEKDKEKSIEFRHRCYKAYFNDAKTIERKIQLIYSLFEFTSINDFILAYGLLANILQVPPNILINNALFKEKKIIDFSLHKEIIHYLFKQATAPLEVQKIVLHTKCKRVLSGRRGINSYSSLYGNPIYHTEAKPMHVATTTLLNSAASASSSSSSTSTSSTETVSKKENSEVITNKNYEELMATLRIPQGISLAQIEVAVDWWTEQLQNNTGKKTISTAYSDGYFDIAFGDTMSQAMNKLPSEPTEKVLKFKESLRKKLLKKIGSPISIYLRADYQGLDILAEALEEAGIVDYHVLPFKTTMEIVGNTVLEDGSIMVNGEPIATVNAQSLISQTKDLATFTVTTRFKEAKKSSEATVNTQTSATTNSNTASDTNTAVDSGTTYTVSPSNDTKRRRLKTK